MKGTVLSSAFDAHKRPIKPGDYVVFVADLYDPHICSGEITKIYDTDPEAENKLWSVKCSVRCDNGYTYRNVQIRRVYRTVRPEVIA